MDMCCTNSEVWVVFKDRGGDYGQGTSVQYLKYNGLVVMYMFVHVCVMCEIYVYMNCVQFMYAHANVFHENNTSSILEVHRLYRKLYTHYCYLYLYTNLSSVVYNV